MPSKSDTHEMKPQITITEIPTHHIAQFSDMVYGAIIFLIFTALTFYACYTLYKQARAMESIESQTHNE